MEFLISEFIICVYEYLCLFRDFFGTANVFEAFDRMFGSDPFARSFFGNYSIHVL